MSIISGNFLAKENVVKSLPFVFYLTLLGILYIANGYNAEKLVRELDDVNDELKELRSEYITIKSDLNYESKQSQVAEKTEAFRTICDVSCIYVVSKAFYTIFQLK